MLPSAVVLDTNVFVAAGFNRRSASAKIVDAVRQGRLRVGWNDATRREIERIMKQIPPLRAQAGARAFCSPGRLTTLAPPAPVSHVPPPPDSHFSPPAPPARAIL